MDNLRQRETMQGIDDLPRVLRTSVALGPSVYITLPADMALKLARRIEDNHQRVQIIKVERAPTGWDFFLYAFVAAQAVTNILVPFIAGLLP